MKPRNVKILVGLGSGIIAVLMTVGNGCSKRGDLSSQLDSSSNAPSGSSGTSSTGTSGSNFIAGVKSVSVVYQKQVLDQLTACAGVESPSDATLLMYESKKGAISTYGTAGSITAPMMMAVTNIAGEICRDLVKQETDYPAKTRVFVNWGLGGTNPPQGSTLSDAVSRMSMACWQKLPTMAETNAIVDLIATVPAGAGAADKSAILLCTAVLSSLNSLLN